MKSQSGQSLIETLISLPLAILGVSVFLVLIWSLVTSLVAHHALYELLICQELEPQPFNCKDLARGKINKTLLTGTLQDLNLYRSESKSQVSAKIFLPLKLTLNISESVALPLAQP